MLSTTFKRSLTLLSTPNRFIISKYFTAPSLKFRPINKVRSEQADKLINKIDDPNLSFADASQILNDISHVLVQNEKARTATVIKHLRRHL